MSEELLKPYKFLKLTELNNNSNIYLNENFRILGKLVRVDYTKNLGLLELENLLIIANFEDISNISVKLNDYYQVFGIIKTYTDTLPFEDISTGNLIKINENSLIIESKIIRNVNDINLNIYLKTIDLLNEYT